MKITTTQGSTVLIDDEDYPLVSRWRWSEAKGYAYTKMSGVTVYLHRLIIGSPSRKNLEVDHINRNPFDNRKENLRWCSHLHNLWNTKIYKNNESGCKGVTWDKVRKKWRVAVGKKSYGRFERYEDAVKQRVACAKIHYGEEIYNG